VDDRVTERAAGVAERPSSEAPSFAEARTQKRALLAQMRGSWQQDTPVSPENVLARWPTDPQADPDAASVLFADFLQRRCRGEEPSIQEYQSRFPQHQTSFANLLSQQAVLRSLGGDSANPESTLALPQKGDAVFGFRLGQELGRGAFARVFLAEQADLASRPVVLKISALEGNEPQTLAQLQHTHIVPIYSVHEDRHAGLRAVCMPYFGGASLSQLLKDLWQETEHPLQGSQFVAALERVQAPTPQALQKRHHEAETGAEPVACSGSEEQTSLHRLRSLNYVRTAAWLVARLAEGLHHAHERGVLHRDIKPSNILISVDGQPLLLDFNLAQDQHADPAQAVLGGTVAYMAPEQLRAVAGRSAALAQSVDERSDIYSLGMVLYETLTGHSPFDQSASYSVMPLLMEAMALERSRATPSLRRERLDVPWSLESIVRKCLTPDPAERYQRADHLAEDLRRFLEDLPLKYAPELSQVERIHKWVRRHPGLTSSGSVATVAVLVLAAVGIAFAAVRGHLIRAQEQIRLTEAAERKRSYQAGTERALCLVNTTLDLHDHLRQGVRVCEETLSLYGVLDAEDWQDQPAWVQLDPADRQQLAEDTRELLLLLAGARVHLAPTDTTALREGLVLLDRADAIRDLPSSRALWLDRARYWNQLHEEQQAAAAQRQAEQTPAHSARDHYLLATAYARKGDRDGFTQAVAELYQALALNPRHYWSHVLRGICYLELKEPALAAGDFEACTALWPDFAWGYFNRGYALDQYGKRGEAVQEYTAALERDPRFVAAHVNRGLTHLELQQYEAALADFAQARELGSNEASVHAGRGMALEALGRHAEAESAFQTAFTCGNNLPRLARNRLRWTYGFAVAKRSPQSAREAFDEVLRHDPNQPEALYGRAMLAMQLKQGTEALSFFDRAIEAAPSFVEAWRYRAVLLARLGHWERASQDINWCLEREPNSGATLYAAACVVARAAEKSADPQVMSQALDLLQKALAQGSSHANAAEDPDLSSLRGQPRFRQLVGGNNDDR
jgi:serine/threonine protein kinase/tetratricopeptide (TPR) repeat protein